MLDGEDHIFEDVKIPAVLDADADGAGGFANDYAAHRDENVRSGYSQDDRSI